METTVINVDELHFGKVIAEDVFANTQFPIVYKNTKVNYEHVDVLKAFQIDKVSIYTDQRKPIQSTDEQPIYTESEELVPEANSFEKDYFDSIQLLKKEFINWESGAKVDLTKIRMLMVPLIEQVLEDRKLIYNLNNLSTPNEYLYHHCIATGLLTASLAQKLNLNRGLCIQLALAGALADCGMAKIPRKIRDKKSTLNASEFNEIRKHPVYSYQMVKDLPILKQEMKEAIFKHHERIDGSGYPIKQKIETTIHYSQIIAVADVFHAMTTERLYRAKQSAFKVVEMIKEEEFGKYDIQAVQALIDLIVDLPIGTTVELSNLEQGIVMFNNKYAPTRPVIKMVNTGEIIDLSSIRSFYIKSIISNG